MTKVAVLSDTHLKKVTPEFKKMWERYFVGADLVLHAGDIVCEELVFFMQRMPFHGVHGNMDPPVVRAMLPSHDVIEIDGTKVGLTHGRGAPEGLEERIIEDFDNVDLIVYGHSHVPVDHVKYGVRFFNPGTATGPSRCGQNTIGLLEFENGEVRGRLTAI